MLAGGEDIEEHLAHGIVRVVERASEGQFHAAFPKQIGDGAGIRDGLCQAVEFRHDQGVALAQGGEGLAEGGAGKESDRPKEMKDLDRSADKMADGSWISMGRCRRGWSMMMLGISRAGW